MPRDPAAALRRGGAERQLGNTTEFAISRTPWWRSVVARWQQGIAPAMVLGLFGWTICTAIHEQGATGVYVIVGFWVLLAIAFAQDLYDRAHGDLPARTDKWR